MTTSQTHLVETEFWLGDTVFLRMDDDERRPGMVTAVSLRPNGVAHEIGWRGGATSWHYEFELSREFQPHLGAHGG